MAPILEPVRHPQTDRAHDCSGRANVADVVGVDLATQRLALAAAQAPRTERFLSDVVIQAGRTGPQIRAPKYGELSESDGFHASMLPPDSL